jgi:hypothetical protein
MTVELSGKGALGSQGEMSDAAFAELLASYEAAVEAAQRNITITRTLAEGLLSGQRPPDDVVREYALQARDDDDRVAELRARIALFRSMAKTH